LNLLDISGEGAAHQDCDGLKNGNPTDKLEVMAKRVAAGSSEFALSQRIGNPHSIILKVGPARILALVTSRERIRLITTRFRMLYCGKVVRYFGDFDPKLKEPEDGW
jgi:hypothetical protein